MYYIKDSHSTGKSTVSPLALAPSWLGKPWLYAWLMRVLTAFALGHVCGQLCPPWMQEQGVEPLDRSLDRRQYCATRGPHLPFAGESQGPCMVGTWRRSGTQPHGGVQESQGTEAHSEKWKLLSERVFLFCFCFILRPGLL